MPQLSRRLQRFVKKLRKRLPIERVILHGSAARGELTESSDIDLVVVGRFHQRFLDRILLVQELVPDGLPVEALCYTPAEFQAGLARGNPFLKDVQTVGRELTGDEPLELRHRGQEREQRRGPHRRRP